MQGASALRPDHGAVQSFGWIGLQAKKCDVGLRTGDPEHHANCFSGIESVWMQISLQPSSSPESESDAQTHGPKHSTGEPNGIGIPTAEARSAPLTTTQAPEASPDNAQELLLKVNVFEAGKGVDNLEIPLRSEDVRHRASKDRCPTVGQQHQDPEEHQIIEPGSGQNCEESGGATDQWGNHLHFMAHRVPTPVLPNDPDQDEADAELAAEMAADGYADDEDGDDEVFDEHGDDDAFLAAAGPQADGQQQPGHAAAGPAAAGPAAEPCCICMASPKDTILLPCGHVCVCSTCAALLEAQGIDDEPEGVYLRPVCRTRVTSRHRLFYA
ncbi:uncharacterized protein LOC124814962 [Hydra vulgaris]|uniref:uncharacterized protein LOC124814962 n=1 Tax=Hydra vulgaris TaxID=6087 RepID=UPI0032EA7EE7